MQTHCEKCCLHFMLQSKLEQIIDLILNHMFPTRVTLKVITISWCI